jgi:hypothetical protein
MAVDDRLIAVDDPSLSLAGLQSKFGSNVDFLLSVVHGVLVPR